MRNPQTIICDIDGCIFEHYGDLSKSLTGDGNLLKGVAEKFKEWEAEGCNIILITGRPEVYREKTLKQLRSFGLPFDQLVMGVKNYPRHLINDIKPNGKLSAYAYNLDRNEGLKDFSLVKT